MRPSDDRGENSLAEDTLGHLILFSVERNANGIELVRSMTDLSSNCCGGGGARSAFGGRRFQSSVTSRGNQRRFFPTRKDVR